MIDNPFDEKEDADRTVVQRATRPAAPPPPRPPAATPTGGEIDLAAVPRIGIGPLAAAAAPLLSLLPRLASDALRVEPAELGRAAREAIDAFLAAARQTGAANDVVEAAHYALCAAVDDVAAATSWGQSGAWGPYSLSSALHRDVKSGERFFVRLSTMMSNPGHFRAALEVFYLCLALGMQGRYRLEPNGAAALERAREGLHQTLVQLRGGWERELAPSWKGLDAPHRAAKSGIPTWSVAAFALALVGGLYAWTAAGLSARTDSVFARLAALPPSAMPGIERVRPPQPPAPPPVVAAPQPDLPARLAQFLAPEIRDGLVSVLADPNRVLVRISNRGMFASGSATVDPAFVSLLTRVGQALRGEPGRVWVIGHSDNQPIRSARFPSNFHLSAARAQAAGSIIAGAEGGTAGRFVAEGRGEAEPVADNETPAGRERNRRIEVVIARGVQP
jgi:type VI secretion system protein ImpK